MRDRIVEPGYVRYVAIASDGVPIVFFKHIETLDTPERRQEINEKMWVELEKYEAARKQSSPTLSFPRRPD